MPLTVNAALTPLNVTDVVPPSDEPLIVTTCPTFADEGVIAAMTGVSYVKVLEALRPSGLVTTSGFEPDVPAGSVNVIAVGVFDVTVAATPPTVTVAPATKSVPLIVTLMPPFVGPLGGTTPLIVGLEMRVNVAGVLALPFEETMMFAEPGVPAGTVAVICEPLTIVNVAATPPNVT